MSSNRKSISQKIHDVLDNAKPIRKVGVNITPKEPQGPAVMPQRADYQVSNSASKTSDTKYDGVIKNTLNYPTSKSRMFNIETSGVVIKEDAKQDHSETVVKLKRANADIEIMNRNIETLTKEKADLNQQIIDNQAIHISSYQNLLAQKNQLEQQFINASQQINNMAQRLDECGSYVGKLETHIQQIEADIQHRDAMIQQRESLINEKEAIKRQLIADIQKCQDDYNDQLKELGKVIGESMEKDKMIKTLNGDIESITRANARNINEISQLRSENTALHAALSGKDSSTQDAFSKHLADVDARRGDVERENETLRKRIDTLKQTLTEATQNINASNDEKVKLQQQIASLQTAKEKIAGELRNAKVEITKCNQELAPQQTSINMLREENKKLHQQITALTTAKPPTTSTTSTPPFQLATTNPFAKLITGAPTPDTSTTGASTATPFVASTLATKSTTTSTTGSQQTGASTASTSAQPQPSTKLTTTSTTGAQQLGAANPSTNTVGQLKLPTSTRGTQQFDSSEYSRFGNPAPSFTLPFKITQHQPQSSAGLQTGVPTATLDASQLRTVPTSATSTLGAQQPAQSQSGTVTLTHGDAPQDTPPVPSEKPFAAWTPTAAIPFAAATPGASSATPAAPWLQIVPTFPSFPPPPFTPQGTGGVPSATPSATSTLGAQQPAATPPATSTLGATADVSISAKPPAAKPPATSTLGATSDVPISAKPPAISATATKPPAGDDLIEREYHEVSTVRYDQILKVLDALEFRVNTGGGKQSIKKTELYGFIKKANIDPLTNGFIRNGNMLFDYMYLLYKKISILKKIKNDPITFAPKIDDCYIPSTIDINIANNRDILGFNYENNSCLSSAWAIQPDPTVTIQQSNPSALLNLKLKITGVPVNSGAYYENIDILNALFRRVDKPNFCIHCDDLISNFITSPDVLYGRFQGSKPVCDNYQASTINGNYIGTIYKDKKIYVPITVVYEGNRYLIPANRTNNIDMYLSRIAEYFTSIKDRITVEYQEVTIDSYVQPSIGELVHSIFYNKDIKLPSIKMSHIYYGNNTLGVRFALICKFICLDYDVVEFLSLKFSAEVAYLYQQQTADNKIDDVSKININGNEVQTVINMFLYIFYVRNHVITNYDNRDLPNEFKLISTNIDKVLHRDLTVDKIINIIYHTNDSSIAAKISSWPVRYSPAKCLINCINELAKPTKELMSRTDTVSEAKTKEIKPIGKILPIHILPSAQLNDFPNHYFWAYGLKLKGHKVYLCKTADEYKEITLYHRTDWRALYSPKESTYTMFLAWCINYPSEAKSKEMATIFNTDSKEHMDKWPVIRVDYDWDLKPRGTDGWNWTMLEALPQQTGSSASTATPALTALTATPVKPALTALTGATAAPAGSPLPAAPAVPLPLLHIPAVPELTASPVDSPVPLPQKQTAAPAAPAGSPVLAAPTLTGPALTALTASPAGSPVPLPLPQKQIAAPSSSPVLAAPAAPAVPAAPAAPAASASSPVSADQLKELKRKFISAAELAKGIKKPGFLKRQISIILTGDGGVLKGLIERYIKDKKIDSINLSQLNEILAGVDTRSDEILPLLQKFIIDASKIDNTTKLKTSAGVLDYIFGQ